MTIIQTIANEYATSYLKETPTYPIKLSALCKRKGIRLCPYSDENVQRICKEFDLTDHMIDNDGFVIGDIIFWDDTQSIERQRATIAHELGHIVLRHTEGSRGCVDCAHCAEMQADSFALNFLFPEERVKC